MPGGDWLKYDDFDVPSIAAALARDGAKPPIASEAAVRAVDSGGDVVLSARLINLVTFETEHAKKPYALSDGDWFLLAQDFKERIERQVAELAVKRDSSFLPAWDLSKHGTELKYNQAVEKSSGDRFLCLDQDEVVTPSSGSIEPCDLWTIDGTFIHVKRWDGSQKLSAHAKQGSNSEQVMRNNQEFRDGLLNKLPVAWRKRNPWKDFSAGFSARNHKVVIAIADAPHRTIPEDLPIFSKMTLMPVILERAKAATGKAESLLRRTIPALSERSSRETGKALAKELVQLNRLMGVFENAIVAGEKLVAQDSQTEPGVRKLARTCLHTAPKLQTRTRHVLRGLAEFARFESTRLGKPPVRAIAARRAKFYDSLVASENFLGSGLHHPHLLVVAASVDEEPAASVTGP